MKYTYVNLFKDMIYEKTGLRQKFHDSHENIQL